METEKRNQIYNIDTRRRIVKAIRVIKQTCAEQENCKTCPFYSWQSPNLCLIQSLKPCDWEAVDPEISPRWRAFGPSLIIEERKEVKPK